MVTKIKYAIKNEYSDLFDPLYENILFKSSVLNGELADDLLKALFEFSELPTNLSRLCEILEDDFSDAKQVAEIIELNPGLAGRVLKLVNSAFYGVRGQISDLRRAVGLMGFNSIRSLLIGASVFMGARSLRLPDEIPLKELWRHSVAVSQISGYLGRRLGGVDASLLVSAGLLHDSGMLILSTIDPVGFLRAIKGANLHGEDLLDNERVISGLTHPLLGCMLALKWNLPKPLWQTIYYQRRPDLAHDNRSAAILMMSEYFTRKNGIGLDGQPAAEEPPALALDILDLDAEHARTLVNEEQIGAVKEMTDVLADLE